ncbi:MAG: hypothetical protein ACLFWL_16945 [Candidatus Brocadiia bacterium]
MKEGKDFIADRVNRCSSHCEDESDKELDTTAFRNVHWVRDPHDATRETGVWAFRREFTVSEEKEFRIHVSADERYELYLNGTFLGRGPERGTPDAWPVESYDMRVQPGRHMMVVIVWRLGDTLAPMAQMGSGAGWPSGYGVLCSQDRSGQSETYRHRAR